jgi:hypothetical protein
MKRSDEIQALANRWGARAASILFPDQPGMRTDMGSTAALLREYAAEIRAREEAATSRDVALELAKKLYPDAASG